MKTVADLVNDTPIKDSEQAHDEHRRIIAELVESVDEFQKRVDRLTAQDKKPSVNKHRRIDD